MDAFIVGLAKRKKGALARRAAKEEDPEEEKSDSGDYSDVEESALADMADALGLDGKGADAFTTALSEYVQSCIERNADEGDEK